MKPPGPVEQKPRAGGAGAATTASDIQAPPVTHAQFRAFCDSLMDIVNRVLGNMPDETEYAHGLDAGFWIRCFREDVLPLTSKFGDLLCEIRKSQVDPVIKELEAELFKSQVSFEKYVAAVRRWIAEIPEGYVPAKSAAPSAWAHQPGYLHSRQIVRETEALIEENIGYLKGVIKAFEALPIIGDSLELLRNLYELVRALNDPEAKENDEVAFYVCGTLVAAIALVITLFFAVELGLIGFVFALVWGFEAAFLEPIAKHEWIDPRTGKIYVPASKEKQEGHILYTPQQAQAMLRVAQSLAAGP